VRPDARSEPARSAARHLLGEHRVVHVVATLPAVLLGVLEAEEPDLGELMEDLVREPALLLPRRRVRLELRRHEPPD
jgi:hypothetical protein